MKKSLVLAMALAMGVSASAMAANPFSDVPAGHWAYASIAKLAAAGVVDGYGDGTYRGDRLMTRYEMAQIVAKAMAKGANVDKLASEFADELDSLGVRVAKLEKKADNVKITGEFRYHYKNMDEKDAAGKDVSDPSYEHNLRSRIWFTGAVNDDWNYVSMLENNQDLTDNEGNETTHFQRAYLEGKLGGMQVSAGRQDFVIADGNIWDARYDGINLSYGDKVKLSGFYGRPASEDNEFGYNKFWGVQADANLGSKTALNVGYTKFSNNDDVAYSDLVPDVSGSSKLLSDDGIFHAGVNYTAGDVGLGVVYLKSNLDSSPDSDLSNTGWVGTVSYAGAEAEKPGSWGLTAKWYNQGFGTFVIHTMDGHAYTEGFQGYSVGANYALAKNIVGNVVYYDTKSKATDATAKTIWSELDFTF
jgi:hypothetical protein